MTQKVFWILLCIYMLTFSPEIAAQHSEYEPHHHHGHVYELGVSLGWANLKEDGENAIGSHVHMQRRLGSEKGLERVSMGLGVEYLFTEHTHISLLGTLSYNPIAALIFDLSPGVLIREHENNKETNYITHLELTYEFDLDTFGFGPVVGIAFSEDDRHYMIGIHFGKGF